MSFELASRIFEGRVLTRSDDRRGYGERRDVSLGAVGTAVILAVVHTDRDGRIQIISAGARTEGRGHAMRTPFERELGPDELAALPDESIDYSDIPELDDAFFATARLVEPDRTQAVTLRVKASVLNAFKAEGKGYQTRMNAVLETYARARLRPRAKIPAGPTTTSRS